MQKFVVPVSAFTGIAGGIDTIYLTKINQMETALSKDELAALKSCTTSFMNHVHVVQQSFHLIPDKNHYGTCINYVDLDEFREEFCSELIATIAEWVYSQKKAKKLLKDFEKEGRTRENAMMKFMLEAFRKFRDRDKRPVFLQGQFGELLLFNFLQHFFGAVPLLRKMPIKTSKKMEANGADAIHYGYHSKKHRLYLGEAKAYSAKYSFKAAFEDALTSLLHTYDTHRSELDLYLFDDFIDDKLLQIARDYKNGVLTNVEIHLAAVIAYTETEKIDLTDEDDIKEQIMEVIAERGKNLDKKKIKDLLKDRGLDGRINYIILPIWKMDELLKEFQKLLGK